VIGPGTQAELVEGGVEQRLFGLAQFADLFQLLARQFSIGAVLTIELQSPRLFDPGAHDGAGFFFGVACQQRLGQRWNLNVQVDAVQKRPG
jgi:hypothetical protein